MSSSAQPGRLVVVSNRVPPPPSAGDAAGGLVAAVLPALEEAGGVWFGWSGDTTNPEAAPAHRLGGAVEFVTLDLTASEVTDYYEGFCNQVLWPLMHGFVERASIRPEQAAVWRAVNARFAEALAGLVRPGDVVWVHDYHLMPLGAALRECGWSGPLGYFHHIPIPSPEVWALIPDADTIAADMAAYDLIGTQTQRDAIRLEQHLASRGVTDATIEAHPISIDPRRVRATAARHPDDPFAADRGGRRVLLGLDRLDYSKAIPQRLEAFEQLLEGDPTLADRALLVQWAALSRAGIPEYEAERRAVEAAVERIHAREFARDPVRFALVTLPAETIAAGLRDADVCLVTSLADGMNLVAKEYVAAQTSANPGVLVLSDGCGAAEELTDALIVRSGDAADLEQAMSSALTMPLEERRRRWERMREQVEAHDVHVWWQRYIEALSQASARRVGS